MNITVFRVYQLNLLTAISMYMKSLFYLFLSIVGAWLFSSCSDDFLGETETTDLDQATVFADSTYTADFLNQIYVDIGFDIQHNRYKDQYNDHGGLQTSCDEAAYKASTGLTTDVMFATGTVNPVTISEDDVWRIAYRNIRRVNVFFKYADGSRMAEAAKEEYKAEARFLRAWYYAMLLRHYGGVALIGDDVYETVEEAIKERNSYADCVEYIVDEANKAAETLPVERSGNKFGRVTRGACKALISRVRLYAASKLFNGSDFAPADFPKELLGYPTYDKETFSGEINIDGDASNETFIVGFLAPRSWNVRQNATVTYREDRYETEVDHKMTVIPDTEQPANYKGMSWSAALKKKYGVRGNVLNDMEWIAFKSDNYPSVNGTIHYTVTIKCNSGKSNLKFRPSFFINHSSDGIGGDEAHYSVKDADDCFEVVEGSGTVIDFCSTHYYQIEPLSALQDDYVTFTFQGDINTNELIKAENVYIEATAYTIEGKIYTVNEKSAKTLMKRETKLPRYNVTLWPGGFFNIPDGETISRIEYIFTNEDGTVSISQSDDSRDNEGEEVEEGIKEPFVFEFQCE